MVRIWKKVSLDRKINLYGEKLQKQSKIKHLINEYRINEY